MATFLTLGALAFQDFEVPESVRIGGEQALAVHKLPGGGRVIDAMGPDDRDLGWSGRFRGANADSRARILEGYRKAGDPLTLTWAGNRYQVFVRSVEIDWNQLEMPYSVSCTVLTDLSSPQPQAIPGLDSVIGSDLASAVTLGGAINVQSVTSTIGAVQTAIGAVTTLKNAPGGSITNIAATIGLAQTAVLGATTQAESALTAAGVLTPGNNPTALVSTLTAQASGFGQLNNLYQAGSTLTRMAKNL